jgi:hypothetical protein
MTNCDVTIQRHPELDSGSGRSQDTLVTRGHQTLKQVQGDDRVPDDGVAR